MADFYVAQYRTFSDELMNEEQVSAVWAWHLIASGLVDPVDIGGNHICLFDIPE